MCRTLGGAFFYLFPTLLSLLAGVQLIISTLGRAYKGRAGGKCHAGGSLPPRQGTERRLCSAERRVWGCSPPFLPHSSLLLPLLLIWNATRGIAAKLIASRESRKRWEGLPDEPTHGAMKRRKLAVAAGFCFSFLLGTLLNVLFIPAFDPQQQRQNAGVTHSLAGSPPDVPGEASRSGSRWDLARQIRERYEEVLRYQQRQPQAAAAGSRLLMRPLERRLMDLAPRRLSSSSSSERNRLKPKAPPAALGTPEAPWDPRSRLELSLSPLRLGCRDISNITNVHYLGSGYTKAVYKAELNGSLAVALKSVDFGGHDIDNCVKVYGSLEDCYRLASYKIIKEMILLQRLRHANILQVRWEGREILIGFFKLCVGWGRLKSSGKKYNKTWNRIRL